MQFFTRQMHQLDVSLTVSQDKVCPNTYVESINVSVKLLW